MICSINAVAAVQYAASMQTREDPFSKLQVIRQAQTESVAAQPMDFDDVLLLPSKPLALSNPVDSQKMAGTD